MIGFEKLSLAQMSGFVKLSFTLPYWVCKTFTGTDWFVKLSFTSINFVNLSLAPIGM